MQKGESVEIGDIVAALEIEESQVREAIDNLKTAYGKSDRGIQIVELENSIQLRTKEEFYDELIKITTVPKKQTLTDAALETLSIVAYKQPVTRLDVEKIRGVNSDSVMSKLVEYGLIKEVGRLDAPGRPLLFGTTEQFLRSFGVKSIFWRISRHRQRRRFRLNSISDISGLDILNRIKKHFIRNEKNRGISKISPIFFILFVL